MLWLLAAALDVGWAMTVLAWLALPASAMMAGYTAFLFGQAEGRDLWQSPLLFWHLLVQAVMVGSGALAVAGLVRRTSPTPPGPCSRRPSWSPPCCTC